MDPNDAERVAAALNQYGDGEIAPLLAGVPAEIRDQDWVRCFERDLSMCREAAALLRSLAKDASRYQWLRDQYRLMSPHMDGNHHWAPKMAAILKGNTVDAAIDSAMARKGEP